MSTNNSAKDQVIEMMLGINTGYHLTITFGKYTPEEACRNDLNKFFKHVNATLYKDQYNRGETFLNGIAIQERSIVMQTFHFHILIEQHQGLPSCDRLKQVIAKHVNYFKKSKHKTTIRDHQLQAYYNNGDNKLEHYLTKQFESSASKYDVALSNVGLLSAEGVCFG
jgi:hypothetical protein